jgi:hypothetical protein
VLIYFEIYPGKSLFFIIGFRKFKLVSRPCSLRGLLYKIASSLVNPFVGTKVTTMFELPNLAVFSFKSYWLIPAV